MNSELVFRLLVAAMVRVRIRVNWASVTIHRRFSHSPRIKPSPAQNDDGSPADNPQCHEDNACERLQFKSRTNPIGHGQRNKDAKHLTYPFGIWESVEAILPSHFRNLTHKGEYICMKPQKTTKNLPSYLDVGVFRLGRVQAGMDRITLKYCSMPCRC